MHCILLDRYVWSVSSVPFYAILGLKFGPIPNAKKPSFFSKLAGKKSQSEAGEKTWKTVCFLFLIATKINDVANFEDDSS